MMMQRAAVLLIPLLFAAAACGGEEGEGAAGRGAAPPALAGASGGTSIDGTGHPCDHFTLAELQAVFDTGAEEVAVERGAVPGNLTCEYRWKKAGWQEVEERNRTEMVRAATSGRFNSFTPERTDGELFITLHGADYSTTADAVRALDAMVERLSTGVSAGSGDATFAVQANYEPVPGVGAKAVWTDQLRQLSAVGGTALYHVRVRVHDDVSADRAHAAEVARRIAASL
jgi:hypothetical protein